MDIGMKSIVELLNEGSKKRFVIPVYQRSYSWQKKNWKKLLEDILNVADKENKNHFFGTIVYVAHDCGQEDERIIVDGQQRITTISLLLIAIRDYLRENSEIIESNVFYPDQIDEQLLTIKSYKAKTAEPILKLKLVKEDDLAYKALIEGKQNFKDSLITKAYSYMYSEIKNMNKDTFSSFCQALDKKLMIVSISLSSERGDDPQLIFESLNSTGVDLLQSDKIRNYVLMNLDSKQQERIYEEYWEKLEHELNSDDINEFIRYYLIMKNGRVIKNDDVYDEFKDYKTRNIFNIEDLLTDLLKFASYFIQIKYPTKDNSLFYKEFQDLLRFKQQADYPFIFDILDNNSKGIISDEDTKSCIKLIEIYFMRRIICEKPSNIYNSTFASLPRTIKEDMEKNNTSYYESFSKILMSREGRATVPNDNEFKDKFMNIKIYESKNIPLAYILERLENHNTKEPIDVQGQLESNIFTIEYIMPQTLNDIWKRELGDNAKYIHEEYVHTIGNLTLTGYNSEYSNKPFMFKKTLEGRGFNYSKLHLNESVKSCSKWTEEEIKNRASLLADEALDIWKLPTIKEKEEIVDDNGWHNFDEVELNLTYCRIKELEILGDKIELDSYKVIDVFAKIHETLYEYFKDAYTNLDWFSLSKNNGFRAPYCIEKIGAYIESNSDSNTKLKQLKEVTSKIKEIDSTWIRFVIEKK